MELGGLPWDFEREKGASAVPSNGSALHHLVTAVSVKKALPGLLELLPPPTGAGQNLLVMRSSHTRVKMRAATGSRIALMTQ